MRQPRISPRQAVELLAGLAATIVGGVWDNRPTASAYSPIEEHGTIGIAVRFADDIALRRCRIAWGAHRPDYFTHALEAVSYTHLQHFPGGPGRFRMEIIVEGVRKKDDFAPSAASGRLPFQPIDEGLFSEAGNPSFGCQAQGGIRQAPGQRRRAERIDEVWRKRGQAGPAVDVAKRIMVQRAKPALVIV